MQQTRADHQLAEQVQDRLDTFAASLPPSLHDEWKALAARLGGGRVATYFLHPLAHPVLQLPAWVSGRPEPAAAESAVLGYLHVRIQDDLFDEGIGQAPGPLLLSDLLLTRHQELLVEVAGHRDIVELSWSTWLAYAEAMLLERRLTDGISPWSTESWDQVLDRSRPLLLPAAAVLMREGRGEELGALREVVDALVEGHQLFLDLVDIAKDTGNANHTWVLQRLHEQRGEVPLEQHLLAGGGFDSVHQEAQQRLEAARAPGRALGLHPLGEWLDERCGLMDRVRREFWETWLRAVLSDRT